MSTGVCSDAAQGSFHRDFYDFNRHDNGLAALALLSDIYTDTISLARDERVQDSAVRYLFEFINTIIGKSGGRLERNLGLVSSIFSSLLEFARKGRHPFLRKSSTYLKATLGLLRDTSAPSNSLSSGIFST